MAAPPPYQLRRTSGTAAASGLRLFLSFALAGVLTLSLFWLLSSLIAPRKERDTAAVIPRIEFSRLKRDTELHTIKRVKPKIEKPPPPPDSPTVAASQSAGGGIGVDVASLAPASVNFGGVGTGEAGLVGSLAANLTFGAGNDRDAVPQVRINPDYPPAARERGIEGWVVVRFDIDADGSTKNIQVIDAQPKNVFEQATKRAVAGWKYSPKIQDGKRVERKGMEVKMAFSLS